MCGVHSKYKTNSRCGIAGSKYIRMANFDRYFQVAFPRGYIHVRVSPMGMWELNKAWGGEGGAAVGLPSKFSGSAGFFFFFLLKYC